MLANVAFNPGYAESGDSADKCAESGIVAPNDVFENSKLRKCTRYPYIMLTAYHRVRVTRWCYQWEAEQSCSIYDCIIRTACKRSRCCRPRCSSCVAASSERLYCFNRSTWWSYFLSSQMRPIIEAADARRRQEQCIVTVRGNASSVGISI